MWMALKVVVLWRLKLTSSMGLLNIWEKLSSPSGCPKSLWTLWPRIQDFHKSRGGKYPNSTVRRLRQIWPVRGKKAVLVGKSASKYIKKRLNFFLRPVSGCTMSWSTEKRKKDILGYQNRLFSAFQLIVQSGGRRHCWWGKVQVST